MAISYKGLWKVLIDNDIDKADLSSVANVSPYFVTKMNKNEAVSMEALQRLCNYFHCKLSDIVEIYPDPDTD